jgi:UDP-glucose 4-epimerase
MSSIVLVTGGCGYIGSHTCVELIEAGYEVIVLDNLSNGKPEALLGVERITGTRPKLIEADLRDLPAIRQACESFRPDAVIHFAGLKAVGESVQFPMRYFENNVAGSINLFKAMQETNCSNLVFSSSCTVYGNPVKLPIDESAPVGDTSSPYGHTKLMIEQVLGALHAADLGWNTSILRYFNPVGAHPSGEIGEDPSGYSDNLMPPVCQVAAGYREQLKVYGGDYPTRDGSCIRDYLHVTDLAIGHLAALRKLEEIPGLMIHNLGTGQGCTVLEVIDAFREASGREIPYEIVERRPGDVTEIWADPTLAERELG